MRITESRLRQIIRETILNEVPLGGNSPFTPIEMHRAQLPAAIVEPEDIEDPSIHSVGYSNASENRPEAIRLFEKIPDNWDIIPVENVDNLAAFVRSLKFKQEIASRGYDKGTKILVIGSQPSEGDFTEAEWVVRHDIIGHAIYKHSIASEKGTRAEDKLKEIRNDIIQNTGDEESKTIAAGLVSWQWPEDQNTRPDYAVWLSLPGELQLSETYQDILPDIYAAIFFGELTAMDITAATLHYLKTRFPSIAEEKRPRIAQNFAISLIETVEDWKASIRPGINIIKLW